MAIVKTGTVNGFRTLKDGTVKMDFQFQEMNPTDTASLFAMNNQFVKVALSGENITRESLIELDNIKVEHEEKSPSKRMRNVLYRLWEQDNEGYEDSELYYRFKMNGFIEHLKNKLT